MNDKKLKETLIAIAQSKGICEPGNERMLRSDRAALIDYYLEMPDWCLERDFPDLHTLTDEFADCEDKGVFVNKTFHGELLNDLQTYIFHNCRGTIKVGLNVDKSLVPMLYLANNCHLRIVGVGEVIPRRPCEVPVYLFGRNQHSAKGNRYVKFNIYKHAIL